MTSTFKHDSAGFLIGDLIDVNHDLLDAQSAGMVVWRGIHSDVKAIARALGVQVRGGRNRQASGGASGGASPAWPARDSRGRYTGRTVDSPAGRTTGGGGSHSAREATTGAQRSSPERAASVAGQDGKRTVATPGGRSARGRFTGVGGTGGWLMRRIVWAVVMHWAASPATVMAAPATRAAAGT